MRFSMMNNLNLGIISIKLQNYRLIKTFDIIRSNEIQRYKFLKKIQMIKLTNLILTNKKIKSNV